MTGISGGMHRASLRFLQKLMLYLSSESLQHRHVTLYGGAAGGEHVAGDAGTCSRCKCPDTVIGHKRASTCETDIYLRIYISEGGNTAKDFILGETSLMLQRCTGYRHETVDGNRDNTELTESYGNVYTILRGFAHADDAA